MATVMLLAMKKCRLDPSLLPPASSVQPFAHVPTMVTSWPTLIVEVPRSEVDVRRDAHDTGSLHCDG